MFSTHPIKIAKEIEAVRRSAFWHLSRRDHSEAELLTKLQRKTENKEWIETVINECLDANYLNDQRFTETFLRSSQNKGHGQSRIQQDLKRKGINEKLIKDSLQESEFNYVDSAQQLLTNKFKEAIATPHLKKKAMGFLQAKGHNFSHINLAIECHNEHFAPPSFNDLEEACLLLSKKFKTSIKQEKSTNKALRYLISHGYDYSISNQAITSFNQTFE